MTHGAVIRLLYHPYDSRYSVFQYTGGTAHTARSGFWVMFRCGTLCRRVRPDAATIVRSTGEVNEGTIIGA